MSVIKINKKIRNALIIVLVLVFFSSSTFVLLTLMEYRSTDKLYEESALKFTAEAKKDGFSEDAKEAEAVKTPIRVDFAALQSINSDIVGWIYCEGTEINYPVLHGEDNDFYLHHAYDRTDNRAGSIFTDVLNAPDFTDANTIIYGHHMKNGAMFAILRNWADQEYYERHPVLWLLTPGQDYQIKLFSGYTTEATSEVYTIFQGPGQEFDTYLQRACANSDFSTDVRVDSRGKFVVLSTCEYDFANARYVLHGMLVPIRQK